MKNALTLYHSFFNTIPYWTWINLMIYGTWTLKVLGLPYWIWIGFMIYWTWTWKTLGLLAGIRLILLCIGLDRLNYSEMQLEKHEDFLNYVSIGISNVAQFP